MFGLVPFVVARATNPSVAVSTCSTRAAIAMMTIIRRPDPFSTFRFGTVVAVSGGELGEFLIPCSLESVVKQIVDMLERDDVRSATSGRHVLGIFD
jgi:hypothetical protein